MDVHCEPPDEKWTQKKKKKAGKHPRKLLQFHLANIMKRQETAIGKSRVAHESYIQKKNQRPK